MNPPSALAGAMSRERKPFTYTPGGIDLSEIKSERMAQRLMRNAMNQGVPETPANLVQSPMPISTPVVMPNYNCLPVQVFPTFSLPANPKALLRTRSNPDPYEGLLNKVDKSAYLEENNSSNVNSFKGSNTLPRTYDSDYNSCLNKSQVNYGAGNYTIPIISNKNNENYLVESTPKQNCKSSNLDDEKSKIYANIRPVYFNIPQETTTFKTAKDYEIATVNIPRDENEQISNQKEEVTIESKKEEITNKNNGDTNAAITLKLPVKKSEAKTEKKVEIVKNSLPDGSIQEVKTTTTITTIDGKTEITTETETSTFPKDCSEDVEYEVVEEEEEEESSEKEVVQNDSAPKSAPISEKVSTITESKETIQVNGKAGGEDVKENNKGASDKDGQIIMQNEKHESSTTKKVVIIQSETQNSDEENEEDDVNDSDNVDDEEVVLLETKAKTDKNKEITTCDEQEIKNKVIENDDGGNEPETAKSKQNGNEETEDDEEYEEIEEEEEEVVEQRQELTKKENDHHPEPGLNQTTEEVEEEFEEAEEADEFEKAKRTENSGPVLEEQNVAQPINSKQDKNNDSNKQAVDEDKIEIKSEVKEIPIQILHETKVEEKVQKPTENVKSEQSVPPIINISSTEPSVPLEKVEEVEIKPIGLPKEVIKKTQTEIITTKTDNPITHSTQTEYNVIQNIVTVNRTTKTLDHAYEEIPDNISTIKTFVPPPLEGNFISSQPVFKPYQASFTPEPQTERRHSLLLERISVERQMPPEIYQNNYQTSNQIYEDKQYLDEPQSEILTVSNVKPSTITKNQHWYQRNETDNQSSTLQSSDTFKNQNQYNQPYYKPQTQSQPFYKPKTQPQSASQPIYQPQIRVQPSPQPTYPPSTPVQSKVQSLNHPQPQPQSIYEPQPASQPLYQTQPQSKSNVQPIYHPQPQYQQNYVDNSSQESYTSTSNKYEYNTYPSYTSQPIWAEKSFDSQPLSSSLSNQSSYLQKDSAESFVKSYQQQLSSSYVPPPWEQDSNYAVNNSTSNFYQATPSKTTFTPNTDWKPSKPIPKFSKPTSTAYIPPAPNQSFVKPVNTSELPRQQGRKTYYSEYERRYISVPETTYIPNETKFQPQPDPSPQYYYDNNEPAEVFEPQWRKELREFKEQASKTTIQTEQTTVPPPWEDDPKYATPKDFTPTPTWTQTVKPRSWRERSFEPEYIGSQEWPKTNTLGRGRPQSSYVKNTFDRVPDRTRGVSVDRYNPNNYQSPLTREHPPPASHILDPIVQGKTYHNPNVPAYHSRASAEPREQPVTYQQPRHRESRTAPVQSRSFKYLQWITGTDD